MINFGYTYFKKLVRFIIIFIITIILFYVINTPFKTLPPLGKFLNPFSGFMQNGISVDKIPVIIYLNGIKDSVIVYWDERRVPHIFANNDYDLYFVQGYLTARDRLWQMDFKSRAAGGRLSEIFGKSTLEYDIFQRRIGLSVSAEKCLEKIIENPETALTLEAYTAGVNAFINELNYKKYPVEYKIFNYQPEPWTPLKTILLIKQLAWNLTNFTDEIDLTNAIKLLDTCEINKLYPLIPPYTEPVVFNNTLYFQPITVKKPRLNHILSSMYFDSSYYLESEYSFGSNNWVVAGRKTAKGFPILCNDPHIDLQLPSFWYEIQLISSSINIYGVSVPGIPNIVIGFNNNIAWGITNAMTDVLDWYKMKLHKSKGLDYLYNNKWIPIDIRIEEIKIKGEKSVIDTVYYTQKGPIVCRSSDSIYEFFNKLPHDAAIRWTGHDISNELEAFFMLNRAKNYNDFIEAISHSDCPGQNYIFACQDGDIAIWHNGKFPLRWTGQGRYIQDGGNAENDWQGWIPRLHLPHEKNPKKGFLSSANQFPIKQNYPYYLNGSYQTFERSARINECLSEMKDITTKDMINLQNDVVNIHAKKVLYVMMSYLDSVSMNEKERANYDILMNWNFEDKAELNAPTIFDFWWKKLSELIWLDDMITPSCTLKFPHHDVTAVLILQEPNSIYIDDKRTLYKEKLSDLLVESFRSVTEELSNKFGEKLRWGQIRFTSINHLAQIPGFGRDKLRTNGGRYTVNVKYTNFGPSWRMVVELGPKVRAWGIYPGGQSGNPGSEFYDNFINDWVQGKIYELLYFNSLKEKNGKIIGTTIIRDKNGS